MTIIFFLNSWKLEQNSLESAPIIMFRRKNTSPERFIVFFLSSHHTSGTYFQKYRTATFAMPPYDTPCLPLFSLWTNGALKKNQSRLRYYHGILFFTVANKKWRSIELSQISHIIVKESEIWVRDFKRPSLTPSFTLLAQSTQVI